MFWHTVTVVGKTASGVQTHLGEHLDCLKNFHLFVLHSFNNQEQRVEPEILCIHTIKINPDKIKDVIGKGGSVIRALTEETGTTIEIEDDGTVKIAATDGEKAKNAIRRIEEITAEIEVGRVYNGKVTRIVDFGAFVAIGGGKEGLVHISQIADKRVEKVTDYLQMGQEVPVKVLEVDRQGRIRLSIKEATEQSQPAAAPEAPAAEQGE